MLTTWLKSGSIPTVPWLMWVLVKQSAQSTGAKGWHFSAPLTRELPLIKSLPPAPVRVHGHRHSPSHECFVWESLTLLLSSRAIFLFFNSAGLGGLIYGTKRKMPRGGNAKGSATVASAMLGCTELSSSFLNHRRRVLCMHKSNDRQNDKNGCEALRKKVENWIDNPGGEVLGLFVVVCDQTFISAHAATNFERWWDPQKVPGPCREARQRRLKGLAADLWGLPPAMKSIAGGGEGSL